MDRVQLRRALGITGWIMVLYHVLMNACVTVAVLMEVLIRLIGVVAAGGYGLDSVYNLLMSAFSSGWGYLLTIAVGLLILLAWKKPRYWKEEIWAKGRPMKPGAFLGILAIFLSAQVVYQLSIVVLELILNAMGLTMMEGLESMSMLDTDNLSMFLYACVGAPIAEELLCRGLVQRTLMPYGKKLAILGSAFLFGMMHGNIFQTPFAFLVGLVLGYAAAEYSIGWAMVLHMINNMVISDWLTRLTAGMGEMTSAVIIWAILLPCAIGAVVTLIRRRREIRAWNHRNVLGPTYTRCFFGSGGVITFTVLMSLSIIFTFVMMITPL